MHVAGALQGSAASPFMIEPPTSGNVTAEWKKPASENEANHKLNGLTGG